MASEIRTITITCGAGASAKYSVSFEKDLNIEGITASERSGLGLTNVHFTIDVDGLFLIRPSMPLAQVGTNYMTKLPIEFSLKKGSTLTVSMTNNSTSSVVVDISLLVK